LSLGDFIKMLAFLLGTNVYYFFRRDTVILIPLSRKSETMLRRVKS